MKKMKVIIDKEKCKGCMLCIDVCPRKMLAPGNEVNRRGMQYITAKDDEKCTGCGLCFMVCPDCAIEITEEENA